MSLFKSEKLKSKKITNSAKGEQCTMNSPVCSYDSTTTVFCHLNEQFSGKGLSLKSMDIAGFYGCSNCHAMYDGNGLDDKYFYLLRAVIRTWKRLIEKEIIKIK